MASRLQQDGCAQMTSSLAWLRRAWIRGRNAAFPSLRPAPADSCRSRRGCLPTRRGRRHGYSSAPVARVRRRRGSSGYNRALLVFARDVPSSAFWSLRSSAPAPAPCGKCEIISCFLVQYTIRRVSPRTSRRALHGNSPSSVSIATCLIVEMHFERYGNRPKGRR